MSAVSKTTRLKNRKSVNRFDTIMHEKSQRSKGQISRVLRSEKVNEERGTVARSQ
jgi:hypothetical protein